METAFKLGRFILQEARGKGVCFLSAKPPFEPGLIQGLAQAGFVLAEPIFNLNKNLDNTWTIPDIAKVSN